jgi:gentisate 1,2-dioxygenase
MTDELTKLYDDMGRNHLTPLWKLEANVMPWSPRPQAMPWLWKWSTL